MSKHIVSVSFVAASIAFVAAFAQLATGSDAAASPLRFTDKQVRIEFNGVRNSMRHTETTKVSFDKPVEHVWAVIEEVRVKYTDGERAFHGTNFGIEATVRPGDQNTVELVGSLGLYDRSNPGDDLITGELRIRVHAVTR